MIEWLVPEASTYARSIDWLFAVILVNFLVDLSYIAVAPRLRRRA